MKKILAFIIAIVLICAMPLAVSAEETIPEAMPETSETTDIFDEITPDAIMAWCHANYEEIIVLVTILLNLIYTIRKNKSLSKTIGTVNNNAVSIAEKSEVAVTAALAKVEEISGAVKGYKDTIAALLEEIRANEQEKMAYKQVLEEVHTHLKTAKLANLELSDEVAELLVLANIPNSKKDELYARHLEARKAIVEAGTTEVKGNDGLEA